MLHVLTVHFRNAKWIEPQRQRLDRFTPADTKRWAVLDGIDPSYAAAFDHVLDIEGHHPTRLNEMARRVSEVAAPEDAMLFVDGDAFPLRDLAPLIELLHDVPLVAVRRDENLGDPQPHPSFCLTTVAFWHGIGGDWRAGYKWVNAAGDTVSDTGGNLLGALVARNETWRPLIRLNRHELHPLWFGVYGDAELGPVAYHHGDGFRKRRGRADHAPIDVPLGRFTSWIYKRMPGFETVHAAQRRWRQARWEQGVGATQERNAASVFDDLVRHDDFYRRFLDP